MTKHANQRLQSLRAKCPDAVICEEARRLRMTVHPTYISGSDEQWDDLYVALTSTNRTVLADLQRKYE